MVHASMQQARTRLREFFEVFDKANEIIRSSYGYPIARLLAPAPPAPGRSEEAGAGVRD